MPELWHTHTLSLRRSAFPVLHCKYYRKMATKTRVMWNCEANVTWCVWDLSKFALQNDHTAGHFPVTCEQFAILRKVLISCCILYFILSRFFNRVAEHSNNNFMDVDNLAVVLTPNVIPSHLCSVTSGTLSLHTSIVRCLISGAGQIGRVTLQRSRDAQKMASGLGMVNRRQQPSRRVKLKPWSSLDSLDSTKEEKVEHRAGARQPAGRRVSSKFKLKCLCFRYNYSRACVHWHGVNGQGNVGWGKTLHCLCSLGAVIFKYRTTSSQLVTCIFFSKLKHMTHIC